MIAISLPVDSELAACYAWEAREFSKKEKATLKLKQQRAKLQLLGAGRQWEGSVRVRERAGDPWESRYGRVTAGGGSRTPFSVSDVNFYLYVYYLYTMILRAFLLP